MRDASLHKSYLKALPQVARFREALQNRKPYDTLRFAASAQLLSTLPRLVEKAMRAEADRSLTICALALKRYAVQTGKYPAKLDELVPNFLAAIPIDYLDGKPLKYRVNSDGSFTLYSVGEDGKDDGGDISPSGEKATRNLWKRRDYVWPPPALPEEVEAYRKEAAGD